MKCSAYQLSLQAGPSADFQFSSFQAAFFGGGARSGMMVVSRSWNPCQRPHSSHKAASLLRPLAMLVVLENKLSGSPTLIPSPCQNQTLRT